MTLDNSIIELLPLLGNKEKKNILSAIKKYLQISKPSQQDIDDYNQEIEEAMLRMDAGIFIKHEDIEAEAKEW
ncbi:MAG: hypothetical protein K1X55_08470 [Chitinophagales bacterium]|nr:hypothetical protein [Chitinophagales bacterium]